MAQKDTYNWKELNENYEKERIKFERRGLQKLADIMKSYSEYLINDVYMAIALTKTSTLMKQILQRLSTGLN